MTQGRRSLKDQMLMRLIVATGWTQGDALAMGLSDSRMHIENALADLVLETLAEHKQHVGYRLNASVLCREALRQLRRSLKARNTRRVLCGQAFGDVFRLGVAEYREGFGLVTYDMEMPVPVDLNDYGRFLQITSLGEMNV